MNMYVAAFAQSIRDGESEPYGWIIDIDHLCTPGDSIGDEAGKMGPKAISEEITARLKAGEGRQFKIYDGDGELYYSGRILTPGDPEGGGQEDFAPLDDFAKPGAGATEIHYYDAAKDAWTEL